MKIKPKTINGITITTAIKSDFKEIRELEIELLKFGCKLSPWMDPKYITKFTREFKKQFSDPKRIFFVAKDTKGKIVGFSEGCIVKELPRFKVTRIGKFANLYVKDSYRSKGIGKVLAQMILKWFKIKKLNSAKILVDSKNIRAYNLYKKIGFKDCTLLLRL